MRNSDRGRYKDRLEALLAATRLSRATCAAHFVFAIFDALFTPASCACGLDGDGLRKRTLIAGALVTLRFENGP